MRMPSINIYVDQDLRDRVTGEMLPVSAICRDALKRELRLKARRENGQPPPKHGRPKGRQK